MHNHLSTKMSASLDTSSPKLQRRPNLLDRIFLRLFRLPISDSFFLKAALVGVLVFILWLLVSFSMSAQVSIPTKGGTFNEGIIGTPRFVNPVLAVARADKDTAALIFDGLMKLGADGTLVPHLAESVTVSEDGLTYNVVLKQNVEFHDGAKLTADDVLFTINRIQEPNILSPLQTNFEGIIIEKLGDHELNFVLPKAYAPFIETLTFGILPAHIWRDVPDAEFSYVQRNSDAIGTGPYRIKKINRNTSGIPESYVLEANENYFGGEPKIKEVVLKFFPSEERIIAAFNKGQIDSIVALDEASIKELVIDGDTSEIQAIPLPRTFAVFFNQNKSPVLRDSAVRKALNVAIDRDALIETTLHGYGLPLFSPIPPGFGIEGSVGTTSENRLEEARAILQNAGWKPNAESGVWEKEIAKEVVPLTFSISTANNPVFQNTAEFLRSSWEALGVTVTVKQFEQTDLAQQIIRPRDYEALLFGTALGRSLDFYSFWHSSKRNDPGLNVSLYTNLVSDAALGKTRTTQNKEERALAIETFAGEIEKDTPAIFLYSPELIYVFPKKIVGETFTGLDEAQERFTSITSWFITTDSVWPFFKSRTE